MCGRAIDAVDTTRENLSSGRFSGPTGARKKVRVRKFSGFKSMGEGPDDGILPDKIFERLRAPGTIKGHPVVFGELV
jgi:hypothetical protein